MRIKVINPNTTECYGMTHFRRNIRGTDLAVLDLERPESDAYRVIVEECRRALTEDRSSVIVLGCAGMADARRCGCTRAAALQMKPGLSS